MKILALPVRPKLICLVFFFGVCTALAQELPPAYPDPKEIPGIEKTKFTTLLLNDKLVDYAATVDVNGQRYATLNAGTNWHVDAVSFKEGANRIIVDFKPGPTKNAKEQSGIVTFVLADDPHPKANHALILYQASTDDNAFCATEIRFQFEGGHAFKLRLREDRWVDADHKKLVYERSSSDGSVWGPYDQRERIWTPEGQLLGDWFSKLSEKLGYLALFESKDFKPDGTLAAEVKNGDGIRRMYSSSGILLREIIYLGGAMNGSYKEYDGQGKLRITGSFKTDQQDGTWIRYDAREMEIARSIYVKGELRSGADKIEAGSATAPAKP